MTISDNQEPIINNSEATVFYEKSFISDDVDVKIFHLNQNDHIFNIINRTNNFYEIDFLKDLNRFLKKDDLVLDIGANIGNHTLYFALICKCDVVSFEPNPLSLIILDKNISENSVQDRVKIIPCGLGAESGKIVKNTFVDVNNLGSTSFHVDSDGDIELKALDSFDFDKNVKLIKIDVEGMELDVIKGAYKTIKKFSPVICVECDDIHRFNEIGNYLKPLNYFPLFVRNYTPTHVFINTEIDQDCIKELYYELSKNNINFFHEINHIKKLINNLGLA